MASNKEYLEYILGQLSELEEITYRTMMGEFIIYYRGKIVGGIYDDRLLVKPVKSAVRYMPTAPYELPYDGAKRMQLSAGDTVSAGMLMCIACSNGSFEYRIKPSKQGGVDYAE